MIVSLLVNSGEKFGLNIFHIQIVFCLLPIIPLLLTSTLCTPAQLAKNGYHYGQAEARGGYSAQWKYSLNLPDGWLQKDAYSVSEDGGYVADCQHRGNAQHPPAPVEGYGENRA